ncbi:extracellular catalytic domain type 1 short-chain-length polyhydroxyalkanoate depolymerase [Rhizobium halophytocola]|uniref:Poly(Hydroxyalkanoate) depolymerase family esterase n=1 Tax=Rhizobium halophytocola TaxID=735519 RepID=A0ABS4E691_9HYPH|nr:PHB depolymerase family esterase [Rhizobium halophytocola]MBP1853470.1 poly(hydroxyalkanoate) depolymerase family esterase [Rhizobium halophytocola]
MNEDFFAAMRRATSSTRALNLTEATAIIQAALAGRPASVEPTAADPDILPPSPGHRQMSPGHRQKPFEVHPEAEIIDVETGQDAQTHAAAQRAGPHERQRRPLHEVVRMLREGRGSAFGAVAEGPLAGMAKPRRPPAIAAGAQFLSRSFSCAAGTRSFKLYIPASAPENPRGLVVMLHGCKQDPDDFATGTGMNTAAEAHGLLVAYPAQTGIENSASCWNWFRPTDQKHGVGEPSIIAGLTERLISEYGLDRRRVFVAGLSAGGAMAAIMGETYPDLYAAVGIHSGLAYGSANDVMSALAAMRGDATAFSGQCRGKSAASQVRTIVFQGSSDRTVHPSNADRIVASASATNTHSAPQTHKARSDGGRRYTRTRYIDEQGIPTLEYWLVDQAGHAWSGGHPSGSFTDPSGPDASHEMLRFFLGTDG